MLFAGGTSTYFPTCWHLVVVYKKQKEEWAKIESERAGEREREERARRRKKYSICIF